MSCWEHASQTGAAYSNTGRTRQQHSRLTKSADPGRRARRFSKKAWNSIPSNDVAHRSSTNKDCHAPCDHVWSASALSALKKCSVANLSAKRQRSVANLSTKRIFSLAKWDFLVANGRMAADFSSPVYCKPALRLLLHVSRYPDIWIYGCQRSGDLRSIYTCQIETLSAFTRVQTSRCIIRDILALCQRNT